MLPWLIIAALAWLILHAIEDTAYAVRGKTSPRLAYRQQRWAARQQRTGKGTPKPQGFWSRGPARRYVFNLWADAWTNANTRRADRVADERAAYAAARAEQVAARDAALAAAKQQSATTPVAPPVPPSAGQLAPAGSPAAPVKDPASIPTPTPEELEAMFARPSVPNPTSADPSGSAAPTSKEAPMNPSTPPPAEVVGHANAKNYTLAMAKAAAAAVVSLETTIAAMQGGKVGGPAIAHLAAAQDAANQMTAALQAAHTVLSKHDVVAEGYQAAPDAGDKDWMTRGE